MQFVADLHIHSKHSRATSRNCDLENLAWWAARKGITVLGTGDFTHPAWFDELRQKLVPAEPGLFRLLPRLEQDVLARLPPSCRREVRFMLSVEISTIYKRDDRTRKVHHLIYMPDFESAAGFNEKLGSIGNIRSDGRPILGLDSRHLLEITLEFGGYLVPAHIWTPWFAVMGSQSGFDHVDHCYADLAQHVFALETGLSSDPAMNARVSSLDRFQLVSNSDAHSPPALGREATVFDTDVDYYAIKRSLETGVGLYGTLEFFPEEGKYHLDGHRKCNVRWEPAQTKQHDGLCEGCGKPVTVGVSHRIDMLSDRFGVEELAHTKQFRSLVALDEIVAEIVGVGKKSKRVTRDVLQLTERLGPELDILQYVPLDDIGASSSTLLAEAIGRLRQGRVFRQGGYDGEYGTIRLFEPGEITRRSADVLFDLPVTQLQNPTPPPASTSADIALVAEEDDEFPAQDGLNEEQRSAIETVDGPLLIVAGPGTGKTRVLTERFAHLINNLGVDATACLAVTFTRRAARELRERLTAVAPNANDVTVTTFHGLGLLILRAHSEEVGLTADFRIANAFENVDKSDECSRSVVDFDDLIQLPLQLLGGDDDEIARTWQQRFAYVAVDEYQDVDAKQYELLRLLTSTHQNLCVVGDPDQAIYSFRGADVGFFLRFEQDFPSARRIALTKNYRSSVAIVDGALSAITPSSFVPNRILRAVRRQPSAAETVTFFEAATEADEAAFVARTTEQLLGGTSLYSFDSGRAETSALHLSFSDVAVLYRTDAQAKALQDAFHHTGIPAQKRSHNKLIDHSGVAEFARFLVGHQCEHAHVAECLLQFGELHRTVDVADVSDLLDPLLRSHGVNRSGFIDELAMGAEIDTWDPRADRVSLLTLHASKGLEFPVVFVVGANDGLLPLRFGDSTNLDEERRLFFVGMTRAQTHLYVSHARSRSRNPGGEQKPVRPSPFLADVDRRVVDLRKTTTKVPASRQLKLL